MVNVGIVLYSNLSWGTANILQTSENKKMWHSLWWTMDYVSVLQLFAAEPPQSTKVLIFKKRSFIYSDLWAGMVHSLIKIMFRDSIYSRYKAELWIKWCVFEWTVVVLLQGISSSDMIKLKKFKNWPELEGSWILDKKKRLSV